MSETTLQEKFALALVSPLGPTRLSFAIKTCATLISTLRTTGANWEQILVPLNAALNGRGREPLSVDTLRGIYCRHAPPATQAEDERPPEGGAASRQLRHDEPRRERPSMVQRQENVMKGEYGAGLSDTLQDADRKAADLQRLKDIS